MKQSTHIGKMSVDKNGAPAPEISLKEKRGRGDMVRKLLNKGKEAKLERQIQPPPAPKKVEEVKKEITKLVLKTTIIK